MRCGICKHKTIKRINLVDRDWCNAHWKQLKHIRSIKNCSHFKKVGKKEKEKPTGIALLMLKALEKGEKSREELVRILGSKQRIFHSKYTLESKGYKIRVKYELVKD